MSGHEMHLVAVQHVQQLRSVQHVMVYLETFRLRRVEQLCVHHHYQRCRLVDICQILRQPAQLFGRHTLLVVARGSAVVVAAIDVIQHHVVHLSDVERIICRSDIIHETASRLLIAHSLVVVVMISDSMENLKSLHLIVDGIQVLRQRITVRIPVQVPGHVAQRNGIHLFVLMQGTVAVQILGKVHKLSQVARAVGQMHITQHKHLIIILSFHLSQREVHTLRCSGVPLHHLVEPRQDSLGRNFISRRNGDKHIPPFLFRLKLVNTPFVGHAHLYTVRYHNTLHRTVGCRYHPVHRRSGIRCETNSLYNINIGSTNLFLAVTTLDEHPVRTAFASVGKLYGKTVFRNTHQHTRIRDSPCRFQNNHIRFRRLVTPGHLERIFPSLATSISEGHSNCTSKLPATASVIPSLLHAISGKTAISKKQSKYAANFFILFLNCKFSQPVPYLFITSYLHDNQRFSSNQKSLIFIAQN